jgi:hypothetical protein
MFIDLLTVKVKIRMKETVPLAEAVTIKMKRMGEEMWKLKKVIGWSFDKQEA